MDERRCLNSTWSDEGDCVFDNNFSITTTTNYFKYSSASKCPTSMRYAYHDAWTSKAQTKPVQFLGVHFQGRKKEFLSMKDVDPKNSWGGSSM